MPNPTPVIVCDGQTLACATTIDPEGRTVLPDDRATLIGDLSIGWGRADVWTQPEPSVLTFTLWEPTGVWLSKIVAGTAIRRGVQVTYNQPTGDRAGTKIIFQGFTTNIDVQARRMRTSRGMVDGWLVQIQASDRSAFIGNENWGAQTLPIETMINRAVRIRNQAAPVGIRQFYFEERFQNGNVKALDVTDKTVMDTVTEMYTSFADQWCYNPSRNVVIRIPGGSNWAPYTLIMARSPTSDVNPLTIRLYPPAWADPTGDEDPMDQAGYPAAYIGACNVSGPVALAANTIQDITHISCTWYDQPNAQDWVSTVVVKDVTPRARLEFESWYNDGVYVDPVMQDVKSTVQKDGSRPTHPEIVWDTSKSGNVPDWGTFESLTIPAQTVRMAALCGDPFAAAIQATDYGPVWHPCGGTITYRDGHWRFVINLAPTTMPLPAGHTPIRPDNLPTNITLADPNQRHFDRSVTPFDLYFVSTTSIYLID